MRTIEKTSSTWRSRTSGGLSTVVVAVVFNDCIQISEAMAEGGPAIAVPVCLLVEISIEFENIMIQYMMKSEKSMKCN